MSKYLYVLATVSIIALAFIGCTGNSAPTAPSVPGANQVNTDLSASQANNPGAGHYLWTYARISIDPVNLTSEITPMRTSEGHYNILSWLEENPCTNCFKISKITPSANGTLLVDISVAHPFTNPFLTGFDVRGIAMFNGSKNYPANSLNTSDRNLGDVELVNADGYTTLYNANTAGSGPKGLEGYKQGKLASSTPPSSVLNGYKRHISQDAGNTRNAFFAGDTVTATYEIDKPAGPIVFGYAVDASWAPPAVKPVTDPIKDFGQNANGPEAWKILWNLTPVGEGLTNLGGSAVLAIDVFTLYPHEYNVRCEIPELFDSQLITGTSVTSGPGYVRYELTIPNSKLAPAGIYKALVAAVRKDNPPSPAWIDLTAYQVVPVQVKAGTQKFNPVAIAAITPNPQDVGQPVHFSDNGSNDPDGGSIVLYEWDWNNDGVYDESGPDKYHTWSTAGTYYVQFRVTDDENAVDSLDSPVQITINSKFNPVAKATASPNPQDEGQQVHFADNGSNDPDGGSITLYQWDWNNDGVYDESGPDKYHTWSTAGTYYVQFRVTDDDGATDILDSPIQITINPVVVPPTWNNAVGGMLDSNCAPCHISGSSGGANFSTYQNAMDSGTIKPGNPSGSKIYTKISGGNHYGQFTDPELSVLYQWILNGAPEN